MAIMSGAAKGGAAASAAGAEGTVMPKMFVSKETLPFLMAFVAGWYDVVCFKHYKAYANMMTGNTLQLAMKVGGGDRADVPLLAAAVLHFSAGFSAFKILDMRMKGRSSCTAVAPLVLALFALADAMRARFPKSKWHMLLLAVAGGIVNSISAEKAKLVTNMMTGHMQKVSGDFADLLCKGMTKEQRMSAWQSMRIVATFCAGVSVGAAAYNVEHKMVLLSRRRFTIVGAVYAALLVLHELPRKRRESEEKVE